jgi:glyoxylase-like metal-dependent hydrolase (beta-lactamase superfamily II)
VRIGAYEVEIFSDGTFKLDGGSMFGVVPKVLWERHKPADERNRVEMDMSCLLIRDTAGHVILVETGAGPKLSDKQREVFGIDRPPALLHELSRRGVRPDDVTLVINTHLHFDHAGGNTYLRDGEPVPTFPRASYVFQKLEWEDAMRPNERTRASYLAPDFAPLEAAGKLELVEDSVELLPGLRVDRLQGHTRGTQTVRVSHGRDLDPRSQEFPGKAQAPVAVGDDEGPPAGPDAVEGRQALEGFAKEHPGAVVVLKNERRFEAPSRHYDPLSSHLDQALPLNHP